jgi:hypothetical protein
MLRQMRGLRETEPGNAEALADGLGNIERSCLRLWEFLEDLGNYRGDDLVQDALKEPSFQPSPGLGADQPKLTNKPPSPFRSRR